MTIAFFSNFLNHHQVNVADELYKMPGIDYFFVETVRMPQWLLNSGYPDLSDRPYIIKAWNSSKEKDKANKLALEADVAMFAGYEVLEYEVARAKKGKLTFDVSERWLKKGLLNILSPRLIKTQWFYYTVFRNQPVYKLCASAYAATDQHKLLSYKGKCFKWGYFPKVEELNINEILLSKRNDRTIKIMWCARFLKWKHPELPVKLARILKRKLCNVRINMFGNGPEYDNIVKLISKYDVGDIVALSGNQPNEMLLKTYSIFIFTSDRNEGWGAVLNEAMSNGCAVVASDKIGAAPFLIKDGCNGFMFKSENLHSLSEKVEQLIYDIELRENFSKEAYYTMRNVWSPGNAADRFLTLSNAIVNGADNSVFKEGPCSNI